MNNQFASNLFQKASERFSVDSLSMTMSEWVEKNTTLKKRPFSLKGYEFQRAICDDMHPDLNVIKISQVGLTEIQIRKALGFLTRNRGTSLIFSLPDEAMYERVSKGRVKPIVNEDKVFNTPEDIQGRSVRSTEIIQLGQSFMYLVPALESAATSISADFVMNDEVDLSDQKMISLFNSRLQGSKYKLSQKFSTPTFPLFGIDLNWQSSDQHLYMCRCDSCGHWQHPEFTREFVHLEGMPDNLSNFTDVTREMRDLLNFDQSYVMCQKCKRPLDLSDPAKRQWVSQYPSRKETRGYKVGPFSTDNLTLPYIFKSLWEFQKNDYVRGFYNTVLGEPYSDGNIQIPIQDIHACMTPDMLPRNLKDYQDLWIGIDVGQICHIVIGAGPSSENIDVVSIYQVRADELVTHCESLCKNYNIRGGCIDRHPYTPTADEVMRVSGGRIIPVEYRGTRDVAIVQDVNNKVTHAQVNRTNFLDRVATRIRKRAMRISGYGQYKNIYVEHLRDMVRSETPEKQAEWVKLQGIDHYFHATGFMLEAPVLADFIRLKCKDEIRTSTLSMVSTVKDGTAGLIGMGNKKRDNLGLIR